jgi:hypothetical protein
MKPELNWYCSVTSFKRLGHKNVFAAGSLSPTPDPPLAPRGGLGTPDLLCYFFRINFQYHLFLKAHYGEYFSAKLSFAKKHKRLPFSWPWRSVKEDLLGKFYSQKNFQKYVFVKNTFAFNIHYYLHKDLKVIPLLKATNENLSKT